MPHKVLALTTSSIQDISSDDILVHSPIEFTAQFPIQTIQMLTHVPRDKSSRWVGEKYSCWIGPLQNDNIYIKVDITHNPSGFKGTVLAGHTEWASRTDFPFKIQLYEQEDEDIDPKKFPLIGEAKFNLDNTKCSEIRWISKGNFTTAHDSMQIMDTILSGFKVPFSILQDQATVTESKLPLNLLRAFEGKPSYYQRFGYSHPPFFKLTYLNDTASPPQSQSVHAYQWALSYLKEEPLSGFVSDFKKVRLNKKQIQVLETYMLNQPNTQKQPTHVLLATLKTRHYAPVIRALMGLTKSYLKLHTETVRKAKTSNKRALALSIIQQHAFMLKNREPENLKRKRAPVFVLFESVIPNTTAYTWPELAKEMGL